jgi:hypothetical protein
MSRQYKNGIPCAPNAQGLQVGDYNGIFCLFQNPNQNDISVVSVTPELNENMSSPPPKKLKLTTK